MLAPAPADVEREPAGLVSAYAGGWQLGEEGTNLVKHTHVGGGIAARCASDGCLVDLDDFVDVLYARNALVGEGLPCGMVEMAIEDRVERVVDKGGLAAAANTGDADKAA